MPCARTVVASTPRASRPASGSHELWDWRRVVDRGKDSMPLPLLDGASGLLLAATTKNQSACIDAESFPRASFSIWRTRSRVRPSDSPISFSVLGVGR